LPNKSISLRIKSNAAFEVERILSSDYTLRDRLICFKTGDKNQPLLRLRLVEVRQGKTMYGYITSVLDPSSSYAVADLYGRRWRIEEAFNTKRLLIKLFVDWFD